MLKKHSLLRGTFILTVTGFATRFIGFFYRMYLSRYFGAENVGLYQLVFPIYALCFSLTSAGIQTAISRCVAKKVSLGFKKEAKLFVTTGLFFSLIASLCCTVFLQTNAHAIASNILKDARCVPLLIALSYALPFASIHSCICGYFLGLRQTKVPAFSQCIEQVIRVLSVFLLCAISIKQNKIITIEAAVYGIVLGEIASSSYCIYSFSKTRWNIRIQNTKELFALAIPLTANRVLINILQSVEAICIPIRLQQYGLSASDSLKIYGVLTGMALPCILFPSAITTSISTMLLPTIADIQASQQKQKLHTVIKKVSGVCFALGFVCCICFLTLGHFAGNVLFHSEMAGKFILVLAWICPFLYTNNAFVSIINGLGKANTAFFINSTGLAIRIASVLYLIPAFGILGYLRGLLVSQLMVSVLCVFFLYVYKKRTE